MHRWGGGDVASADGLRFVVPVRTIQAGPNPKYFGYALSVTYYNLVSDQYTGLNGIVVPRHSPRQSQPVAIVLEQPTELHPTEIMTDTGAYTDVVFGLFWLLGDRFSPRIADIGGARYWRIDPSVDYGPLNDIAAHRINANSLRSTGTICCGWLDHSSSVWFRRPPSCERYRSAIVQQNWRKPSPNCAASTKQFTRSLTSTMKPTSSYTPAIKQR